MCIQVAASGDVVIQKQRFAIAGTRAPVSATPLCLFLYVHPHLHRSKILLAGRHQGCRVLQCMELVSSCYGKDVHLNLRG